MDITVNGRPPVTAQRPERTERALLLSVIRAEEGGRLRDSTALHLAPVKLCRVRRADEFINYSTR